MKPNRILTVAALDSSGGAGLNQDIRVCSLLGKQVQTCLTGVTIQTNEGVVAIHPVSDALLSSQLGNVLKNSEIRLIKIGALCSPSQVDVLLENLRRPRPYQVILDPVLNPSRGLDFIADRDLGRYRKLLGVADFLCPNLTELGILASTQIGNFDTAVQAAKSLASTHGITILLKGGHGKGEKIEEALVTSNKAVLLSHDRHSWTYNHGTGCAFASAFMCYLSDDFRPGDASKLASQWVVDFYDRLNSLVPSQMN